MHRHACVNIYELGINYDRINIDRINIDRSNIDHPIRIRDPLGGHIDIVGHAEFMGQRKIFLPHFWPSQ